MVNGVTRGKHDGRIVKDADLLGTKLFRTDGFHLDERTEHQLNLKSARYCETKIFFIISVLKNYSQLIHENRQSTPK